MHQFQKKLLLSKVHILWEGHKILLNPHQIFDWQYIGQLIGGDFENFCGLLRIYEVTWGLGVLKYSNGTIASFSLWELPIGTTNWPQIVQNLTFAHHILMHLPVKKNWTRVAINSYLLLTVRTLIWYVMCSRQIFFNSHYGNMGCRVFKRGYKIRKIFA